MRPLQDLAPQGDKTAQKQQSTRIGSRCFYAMRKDKALSNKILAATLCDKKPQERLKKPRVVRLRNYNAGFALTPTLSREERESSYALAL